MPFGVDNPSIARRNLANALMACSTLLLFQGTPSWFKKVKSLFRFFSNRSLHFNAASLWLVFYSTDAA